MNCFHQKMTNLSIPSCQAKMTIRGSALKQLAPRGSSAEVLKPEDQISYSTIPILISLDSFSTYPGKVLSSVSRPPDPSALPSLRQGCKEHSGNVLILSSSGRGRNSGEAQVIFTRMEASDSRKQRSTRVLRRWMKAGYGFT